MEHIVKKHVRIHAPTDHVWDALTDPEKTKKYFFNARVISSWKVGSSITFKGRMFWIIPFKMSGKIEDIEPKKILKYTLNNKDGSTSTVTDKLSFTDGWTTVEITDDVGTAEGAEKRFHRSQKGWDKVLKGLKELVEGNS